MKEGAPGTSRGYRNRELPQDARLYSELNSWTLHISKRDQCLIIDTTDYHSGPLYLTQKDLQLILESLLSP